MSNKCNALLHETLNVTELIIRNIDRPPYSPNLTPCVIKQKIVERATGYTNYFERGKTNEKYLPFIYNYRIRFRHEEYAVDTQHESTHYNLI